MGRRDDDRGRLAGWLDTVLDAVRREEGDAAESDPGSASARDPGGAACYREVFDRLDESIVAYDTDDRYLIGNLAYHRRYPHLPMDGTLAGTSFARILDYAREAGTLIERQAVDDPATYIARRTAELRQPDGSRSERLTSSGNWDLLRLKVTSLGFRLSIRTDITEQKRGQDDLRLALERLETEVAQRAAFVAKLSHELRTPLTAILGYAGMIEGEVIGPVGQPRYREYAASVAQAGQRLLDLVNQILHLSRLEAGRMEVAEATIDLVDMLRREISVVQPMARDNQTTLALNLPSSFPGLRADPRLLRQMILNLLSNAVRFTVRGTVLVSLARRDDGGIDLRVVDNGVGMAPEIVARAGEPYFRGPELPAGGEPGTGLGLAVVKELIGLHQGQLSLASTPGRGTIATLSFPAERTVHPASPAQNGGSDGRS